MATENKITFPGYSFCPWGASLSSSSPCLWWPVSLGYWAKEVDSKEKKKIICLDSPFLLAWDLTQLSLSDYVTPDKSFPLSGLQLVGSSVKRVHYLPHSDGMKWGTTWMRKRCINGKC